MTDKDKVPEKIDLNEILGEDAATGGEEIEVLDAFDDEMPDERPAARPDPHPPAPVAAVERASHGEGADPYKDLWIRARADFENFRKRIEREREEEATQAGAALVRDLLPVLDNLQRALEKAPPGDSFAEGVVLIHKQLQDALFRAGLRPIKAAGEPFDPAYHEAVVTESTDAFESNHVLAEIQPGYTFRGRVVRPSLVKVSVRGKRGRPDGDTVDGD
jgi:molecular chaperone GrpE